MPIIKREDRTAERFRDRAITVYGFGDKRPPSVSRIPVPDNVVLCDVCNVEITTPKINLLYLSKRDKYPYGTLCEGCRVKYHGKVEVVDVGS